MADTPKKILKVYDQGGAYKTMVVEPKTTSAEVCEKLGKKLFMKNGVGLFNLFVFEGGVRQSLRMTDFPYETILRLEKRDFKFYFLNINGEFMNFDNQTAGSSMNVVNSAQGGSMSQQQRAAVSNTSGSPSLTSAYPTAYGSGAPGSPAMASQQAPVSSAPSGPRGMKGYLLRKKAGKFFKVWAVTSGNHLMFYSSEEDTEPQIELLMENAVIDLKASEQGPYILITLSNSERHTLMSENQSELQSWATELAATTAYTGGNSTSRGHAPSQMSFVPSSKDLTTKLAAKVENPETLSATLVRWTEYVVGRRSGLQHSRNIAACYNDGSVLVNVIDALFDRQVRYRKGKTVYDSQSNVEAVLEGLKSLGCDYGKILPNDIIECKVPRTVTRLLWSIFVAFVTNGEKEYVLKDKLVGWCGRKVQEVNRSVIVDGPSALFNPLAFAYLISRYQSHLINVDSLASRSRIEQAQTILDIAHTHLGIPKILDANCWQEDVADDKSFMVYLSFFYFKLSGEAEDRNRLLSACAMDKPAMEPTEITTNTRPLPSAPGAPSAKSFAPKPSAGGVKPAPGPGRPMAAAPNGAVSRPPAPDPSAANSRPPALGAPISKPAGKPMAKPLAKPMAKPMAKPGAKPVPAARAPMDDPEKAAKERARKEAEEKAERLAHQLELEMLENEREDFDFLEEEERRKKEDRDEMAQLMELERMQREEFEREEAAKRQAQEQRQRQQQQQQQQPKQPQMKQQPRQLPQQPQQSRPKQAAPSQPIVKSTSIDDLEDELDMIMRKEQEENQRFMEMMGMVTPSTSTSSSSMYDSPPPLGSAPSSNSYSNSNSNANSYKPTPAPAAAPPKRVLNERDSIMSVFDKLDEELSFIHHTPSAKAQQQQPQYDPYGFAQQSGGSQPSSKPTSPRPSEHSIMQKASSISIPAPPPAPEPERVPSPPPQQQTPQPQAPPPQQTPQPTPESRGKVVVRICLEGFGDVLFCSFAIGYDTLCGNVRQMVLKKMKVAKEFEQEYSLYIVRDGLERVLDDDEVLLEAEDKIDRFVFKVSDNFDRKSMLSSHRG
ncbi:hypothetical protein SAMD00019534_044820 [Acytostelium subglobosum LB1]|uniref:hypothetical protein n=1 Tax=Acytostelium subglobosum LB1 TaxID=1410327 RepID=UPI0006448B38|nr:hypothetical protein SAMD00019534_044820 [Acytostelium subglobosum LB1]GAM21307.1 hypothetical protein SAMD00019534_044820 [Acytostelium subglobosum LB1]|eukprot:XP_012755426.1 hypothetical protein SAMD00019534_044820 [Acytostelium subglobosum LB1]